MSVYQCKQTGRLFVQFNFRGRTYKRRLPATATKEDARLFEAKLKNQVFFENGIEERSEMLWETFVDRVYLEYVEANQPSASLERAIHVLRDSMPFFRGKTLRQIKAADVERFKAHRIAKPTIHGKTRKPATVQRELKIISAVFSMAVKNDLCDYNPVSRVKVPAFDNVQDRILRYEDEDRFLLAFRNSLQRDVAAVVLYTGLRQNDVLGLRKDQVDWNANEIRLVQGKTKRRVSIPMLGRVRAILAGRLDNGSDLFFPSYRTGGQCKSIKNGIRFACIRAGIPVLTIRDLRRTFGTRLHENGFDDKTVADLLGHSGLRSVHRYKRGTEIKKRAILSLERPAASASMSASPVDSPPDAVANLLKILVEMRGIEPLTSALRTQDSGVIIH